MDLPYRGHPARFPKHPVGFRREPYDRTVAEDALKLQGIFGLDGLSPAEMGRAIEIACSEKRYDGSVYDYGHVERPQEAMFADWTDEQIVRTFGESPFIQSRPRTTCDNPDCSANVVGHSEATEVDLVGGDPDPHMAQIAEAMGVDLGEITAEYLSPNESAFDLRCELL